MCLTNQQSAVCGLASGPLLSLELPAAISTSAYSFKGSNMILIYVHCISKQVQQWISRKKRHAGLTTVASKGRGSKPWKPDLTN